MFGRNRRNSNETPDSKASRWQRGNRRRQERTTGDSHEAFSDFLHAIGNIARGQAFYFADRYRTKAADVLDDFAVSLRDVGEQRSFEGGHAALAEDIADDLEDLSDVIRDIRLTSAVSQVEQLVRRRPIAFGIGAVAAGYLITRAAARSTQGSGRGRRGGRF